jgi:WD40 repeat protein
MRRRLDLDLADELAVRVRALTCVRCHDRSMPARRRTAVSIVALLGVLALVGATARAIYKASLPVVIRDRVDRDDAFGIALSPDGDVIAKASRRGARLLSIPDGEVVRTLIGEVIGHSIVHAIAFTPDGQRVVTGDHDGNVIVWSARTGDVARRLPGHRGRVLALAVSPDGNLVATSGSDDRVQVASLADGSVARVFSSSYALGVAFSPRGDRIAFINIESGARVCSLSDGATVLDMTVKGRDIAFACDGASLAVATSDANVEIHDAATGALVRTIASTIPGMGYGSTAAHVAALPARDAWVVVLHQAGLYQCEVRVISALDGRCTRRLEVPELVQSLAVSPDGSRIAVGGHLGTVWIWRTSLPFTFGR